MRTHSRAVDTCAPQQTDLKFRLPVLTAIALPSAAEQGIDLQKITGRWVEEDPLDIAQRKAGGGEKRDHFLPRTLLS